MRCSLILCALLGSISLLPAQNTQPRWKKLTAIRTGQPSVLVLTLSPDGKTLATAAYEGPVKLWDACTGRLKTSIGTARSQTLTAGFTADGKMLVTTNRAGDVVVWDLAGNRQRKAFSLRRAEYTAAAVSPDGKTLWTAASASGNCPIQSFDLESGKPGQALAGHPLSALTLMFAADSKTLMSVGGRARTPADGPGVAESDNIVPDIKLWDLAGGTAVTVPLTGATFSLSADGKVLAVKAQAVRTYLPRIDVWDTGEKKQSASFPLGNELVVGIDLSPDGKVVASGGYSKVVRLRDTVRGKELAALTGHPAEIMKVAFSGDGGALASGDMKGTVLVWARNAGR